MDLLYHAPEGRGIRPRRDSRFFHENTLFLDMQYKDFHELSIWRDGYDILMKIYSMSEAFPSEERFALTSQLRRSANSIIANIAESHGRYAYKDKVRVLYIARGEIVETRSHLAVAFGRTYIDNIMFKELNSIYVTLTIDLNKYIKSLS